MRLRETNAALLSAFALLLAIGCDAEAGDVGEVADTEGGGGGGSETAMTTEIESTSGTETFGGESSGGETDAMASECEFDGAFGCCLDADYDGVPVGEDNEPQVPNADQGDFDSDGIADVVDLCPTVPGGDSDSDRDGIGNECDVCGETLAIYNQFAPQGAVPDFMLVRSIPDTLDTDHDGVGDVCDNCPTVPNCLDFDSDNPFEVGDEIPAVDYTTCQADADQDGIGDACESLQDPDAAGPVGFSDQHDFDQDGISNINDFCPRQALPEPERIACSQPDDPACGPSRSCSPEGWCNHVDSDGDRVGDACDTCADRSNPNQVMTGGAQEDDPDGDFVGAACEAQCSERADPPPIGFYPVAVQGECCVQQLIEDAPSGDLYRADQCEAGTVLTDCPPLLAPHPENSSTRLPVRSQARCSDAQVAAFECAQLPAWVEARPGVLTAPPGCDAALTEAGLTVEENMILGGPQGDQPWDMACQLPQADPDFDGIGSACDLCPLAFDPQNLQFVDSNGRLWPNDGAYCNGNYALKCEE